MHIKWPNKENINLFFLFYFLKHQNQQKPSEKIIIKKSKKRVIYLITINVSPALTASPGSTKISVTSPSTSD